VPRALVLLSEGPAPKTTLHGFPLPFSTGYATYEPAAQ